MGQLLNKTIKRAASFFVVAILLLGTVCTFASCQSSSPKVTMTVSFNNRTYTLRYKLYRKFFPQTVQHFIELADAGFYNDLCFHDYQRSTGMFSGGYTYNEELSGNDITRGLEARQYFSWLAENEVGLTQSVFRYVEEGQVPADNTGTNTLVGEFENNNYSIRNNEKNYGANKRGALVMYYTPKSEARITNVTVKRNTAREENGSIAGNARWYDSRSYAMNSATSLFYISFTSESSVNKNYCVFGELYNDAAEEEYDNLVTAISAYSNALPSDDEDGDAFLEETAALPVDAEDWYYGGYNLTATYQVPVSPIVIKSVKVDRY